MRIDVRVAPHHVISKAVIVTAVGSELVSRKGAHKGTLGQPASPTSKSASEYGNRLESPQRRFVCEKQILKIRYLGEEGTSTNAKIFCTCRGDLQLFVTGIYLDDRG